MERLFWKNTLEDKDSFKLVLFLFGNGCPATVIVSSTFWKKNKTVKQWEQVNWILRNISRHERRWLYFDLHFKKYLFMDRSGRKENQM